MTIRCMAFPPLFGVIHYIIPLFSGERKRFAKKSPVLQQATFQLLNYDGQMVVFSCSQHRVDVAANKAALLPPEGQTFGKISFVNGLAGEIGRIDTGRCV